MTPLTGKRILITRPQAQARPLLEKLAALGATPIALATIEIAPPEDTSQLDAAIRELSAYAWVIFTSVNGVSAFWERFNALGQTQVAWDGRHVAAIGPATAQALRQHGIEPDFVPEAFVAEAILPGLGEVRGQRILLPRADLARAALVEELRQRGALPDEITAYRTRPTALSPEAVRELEKGVDVATFTSSSTVRNYFDLLGQRAAELLRGATIACIGPITAETARAYGLPVDILAPVYTTDGLVEAIVHHFSPSLSEKIP